MSGKLWGKGGGELDAELAAHTEAFTVGDDPEVDANILEYDCWASIAHAATLHRAEVLTDEELARVQAALLGLIERHRTEGVPISRSQEDCHTAIEQALTDELGDLGKKIHTGRSRNDQVLTAVRLFTRERLLQVADLVSALVRTLLIRAHGADKVPMRGYSHTQPAMPTTLAVWLGAHAEGLQDDLLLLKGAYDFNDLCPLGSAAGFGSVVPLDRMYTATLLDFKRVQVNALYCQNSRGKQEGAVLHALEAVAGSLASLATDLILFCTREYGFVRLRDEMTTGSSIMPQKRNPDVLELVRAREGTVAGAAEEVRRVASKLPSGYNRDYQLLKAPLVRALDTVTSCLTIMDYTVSTLAWDEQAMAASCTKEIYAADLALELSLQGVPFRDAYRQSMDELEQVEVDAAFVQARMSAYKTLGSMGDPGLERLDRRCANSDSWTRREWERMGKFRHRLRGPLD